MRLRTANVRRRRAEAAALGKLTMDPRAFTDAAGHELVCTSFGTTDWNFMTGEYRRVFYAPSRRPKRAPVTKQET